MSPDPVDLRKAVLIRSTAACTSIRILSMILSMTNKATWSMIAAADRSMHVHDHVHDTFFKKVLNL